ncbi:uncharacterized protein LOC129771694 [Toxorhynchites rutilus septentrionalis]|uniref:uncharacterized protein LOC129771694 n=1 Tax=Toxorhynchites rutilus septentrionalis TaxID=329112 RepID=UPI0024788122|nr:uncharacterized protein LOC129771694 [Toxorhynchites rutilus septentrionalis]
MQIERNKIFVVIIYVLLNKITSYVAVEPSKINLKNHAATKRSSDYYIFSSNEKSSLDFGAAVDDKLLDDDPLYSARYFTEFHNTDNKCSVDKFAFNNEGTVTYEQSLPALEQFTLCAWTRFTNHTGDHTIITYAVQNESREIQLWIANARGMSFISLAVHGQSLFRLNYPFRMRKWHHICASWNGKTGEWQLWIKAERIGRGFHNRLVDYSIKPNGKLFSGGPSITGPIDTDLHFELTMVHIYKVALSAGKAHRDHKHHHVHHFDHNGGEVTPNPPTTASQIAPQPLNPSLASGHIPTRVELNIPERNPQPPGNLGIPVKGLPSQLIDGSLPSDAATITTQFVSGQFHVGERNLQQQLVIGNILGKIKPEDSALPKTHSSIIFPEEIIPRRHTSYIDLNSPANVRIIETTGPKAVIKREVNPEKLKKRGLVLLGDGTIIDNETDKNSEYIFDGLAEFGQPEFKHKLGKETDIEGEIREHDKEPAEGEVAAVMNLCTKCDNEPFVGAIVFAWKNIRIHMEDTLKAKASVICGEF